MAWSTTVLGGRVAAAPPDTVSVPRGELSVPHTSSYVPPSRRLWRLTTKPGKMFSASSMTSVAAEDLELAHVPARVGHLEGDDPGGHLESSRLASAFGDRDRDADLVLRSLAASARSTRPARMAGRVTDSGTVGGLLGGTGDVRG